MTRSVTTNLNSIKVQSIFESKGPRTVWWPARIRRFRSPCRLCTMTYALRSSHNGAEEDGGAEGAAHRGEA